MYQSERASNATFSLPAVCALIVAELIIVWGGLFDRRWLALVWGTYEVSEGEHTSTAPRSLKCARISYGRPEMATGVWWVSELVSREQMEAACGYTGCPWSKMKQTSSA